MAVKDKPLIKSKDEYLWTEDWVLIPESNEKRQNGRTHGIVYTKNNTILVFHQAFNGLVNYSLDGKILSATGKDRWMGAHGITAYQENDQEYYWLTDEFSGYVDKVDIDGRIIQSLKVPVHSVYTEPKAKQYKPTWAAQNPENGDIWVADGYGGEIVIRYDRLGNQIDVLDGTEGRGRFQQPHGLGIRSKKDGVHELFITDRASRQVVVYDLEGHFLRAGNQFHSPCSFCFTDTQVIVPELFSGIKILNIESLELQVEIGISDRVIPNDQSSEEWGLKSSPEGYPNLRGTKDLISGMFSSPHGACIAPNGDIYVVEWIIGGRITKLERIQNLRV